MAAFSRGLGLAMSQRIFSFVPTTASKTCSERPMARVAQAIRRSPILQAARNLQTSTRLQASKLKHQPKSRAPPTTRPNTLARVEHGLAPAKHATSPKPGARGAPQGAVSLPVASPAVAAKLAALGRPTILYQSTGHFWLRFSSIAAALFCTLYAGINYSANIMYPPPDLSKWIILAFACICLFMGGLGYLFFISTARIVRRITAVPTSSLPEAYLRPDTLSTSKMPEAEKAALRALQASPIALECEVAGTIPLIGDRRIVAALSEVFVPFEWQHTPLTTGAVAPTGIQGWFLSMRRGLLAEGFSPVMIKGQRYKIDILVGKIFDNGRTPQLLLPARGDQFTDTVLDRILKR